MKIYVLTSDGMTVATFDNDLSGALKYFDDEFHRYLETGASTFDLSVAKRFQMYSNGSKGTEDDFQYLKENNYLVFTYKNQDFKFKIRRIEETETSLRLFCDNLSLDLINEYRGPATYNKAYKLAKYINDVIVDSGYQIGTNEFLSNERTLKWDGDQTVLARILSIANSFGAEVEFETILNDDRTTKQNLIHFRKRVGIDRPDIELKYGRNVSSISRNVDITELITAIKPRGHEENDVTTTIKNVAKEVKDEDGNVKFYTKKGSEYIYAPQANQVYGQPKFKGGGYIVGQFSYDTKSETELFNRALAELEKKCLPAYEFEIEGYYDVEIGDTIRAIDEAYNPILMLEARISEQVISFSDPSKNKTVYSNYKILENKVNQSLLDRIDAVKKYAEQVAKTYIFSINNIGSPMFKNGTGEVTFTALIEKNNQDMTGEFTSYNWTKQNKDGSQDEDWNAAHLGIGKSITVKPSDITDTATFSYEALQEGLSIGGASGVVTNVNDGEDGKTPVKGVDYFDGEDGTNGLSSYLHIRYSQNANGNPMTESPTNAKYMGMQTSQNTNASTVPSDYRWSEIKGQDGLPGETGSDGKTSYLHIKYSNDGGKTFTGNNGEDAGAYIGQYVDFTQADSLDVKAYTWSKIKGETGSKGDKGDPGNQGLPGTPGADGKTPYTHWAYAWSDGGTDRFTDTYPNENELPSSRSPKVKTYQGSVITTVDNTVVPEWGATDAVKHTITGGTHAQVAGVLPSGKLVDAGYSYVHSIYIKNTGAVPVMINNNLGQSVSVAPNESKHVIFNPGGHATGNASKQLVFYRSGTTQVQEFIIWHAKIEKSSTTATIWTPLPSESFEDAYPTYTGMYVDYEQNDSQEPTKYKWTRTLGENGQDGSDGTDGADGVGISTTAVHYQASVSGTTPPTGTWSTTVPSVAANQFLWTRTTLTYTNNKNSTSYSVGKMGANGTNGSNGKDGTDGKDGSNGVSVSSVIEEYYVSTSPNSQTGGSWTTTVPNNANPNLYVFRRMQTTMSNGTVTYTSPALIQGMTGIYPYIGPTQPANPKEGQQWWKSDTSGNVTDLYVYKSGGWQGQTIQQSILNIVALNAVTITGSNIVGTVINGSEFVNAGSFTDASAVIEYLTTIKGPIQMEYNVKDTTQNGTFIINPRTIVNSLYKDTARNLLQSQWSIGSGGFSVTEGNAEEKNRKNTAVSANGIFMEDATMTYGKVSLAYQDLMSVPATLIPANSGFSQYQTTGNSTPLVSRQGRLVQLSGAFKNNAEIASGGSGTMGTLPIWARPERNVTLRVQGSGNNTFMLTVEPTGLIKMGRYSAGANDIAVAAGSWLNIAISFAAKDI